MNVSRGANFEPRSLMFAKKDPQMRVSQASPREMFGNFKNFIYRMVKIRETGGC
jgi:hypothetical protein